MILDQVIKVLFTEYFLYLKISRLALTATATAEVQQDIMEKLNIGKNDEIKTSTKRRNLIFSEPNVPTSKFVVDYVTSHEGQAGIIYCSTRKQVEELNEALENENVKSTIYRWSHK